MSRADQFFTGVAADGAKLVVRVPDVSRCIGDADNRMLIECELQVVELIALRFTFADQCGADSDSISSPTSTASG
jgi:hypothetical protein